MTLESDPGKGTVSPKWEGNEEAIGDPDEQRVLLAALSSF